MTIKGSKLIAIVEYNSWRDFVVSPSTIFSRENFLWRGQSNSEWEIISSYTRETEEECRKVLASGNCVPSQSNVDGGNTCWSREFKLRRTEGFLISSDYDWLLDNIPEENVRFDVGRHRHFSTGRQESLLLSLYQERLQSFWDRAKTEEDRGLYQRFGSPYDVTFGVDIDLALWSWGQHYGVETPLVDWTEYALFALFFACDNYKNAEKIAVYSLNINALEDLDRNNTPVFMPSFTKDSFISFYKHFFQGIPIWAFWSGTKETEWKDLQEAMALFDDMRKLKLIAPDNRRLINDRCTAQAGWFTFAPGGISIEEWCRRLELAFADFELAQPFPLLTKYVIRFSKDDREKCLSFLEEANINAKTLYPDFYGISHYLRERREKKRSMFFPK